MTKADALEMFGKKRAECQAAAEQNERDREANLGAVRVMDQLIATVNAQADGAEIEPEVATDEPELSADILKEAP